MFKCDMCGECCRNLDQTDLAGDLDRGDGTCIYLDGNKCSIYADRPLLCRVEDSYNVFFKDKYSLEEYYEMNYKVCDVLKREAKGDK